MITLNGTTWRKALEVIKDRPADVFMVQEHRLAKEDDIKDAAHALKGLGYKSLWSPAVETKKRGDQAMQAIR